MGLPLECTIIPGGPETETEIKMYTEKKSARRKRTKAKIYILEITSTHPYLFGNNKGTFRNVKVIPNRERYE